MELLGNNPSMQDLIEKLNEIVGSLNNSLPNTDSEIAEVKKLVSFGSGVLAGRLNAKLWYFKTQELMTASTELCEGDSCFVLKDGATTGEGTFEYWYIYKTSDVVDIIDSYVDLSNPDLVAVKLQDMTLKDVKDTLSAQISDQSKDLNTKISNLRTDTETALSGKADLVNGLIPASQLPSYVDDIVESWLEDIEFPENAYAKEDTEMTTPLTPEFSKIYVNLLNNKTYRWGGSFYVEVSKSLAIGETATTAFAGDRGKTLETKIQNSINYVTPEMFGARGDGITDDTQAIQDALNFNCKTIIFSGNYRVNGNEKNTNILTVPSNKILLLNNAAILLDSNNLTSYHILHIKNSDNIKIIGGYIRGDKDFYEFENSSEWCHGIAVDGGKNIEIVGTIVEYCRGDGIVFGNDLVENGIVDKCICNENGRNGLTVTNGKNITITNSYFNNTNRTPPMFGIDLEPNPGAAQHLINVTIDNCKFVGNLFGSIQILSLEDDDNITISNCICYGTITSAIKGDNSHIKIYNCYIKPFSFVEPNTLEWSYNIDKGMSFACTETSAIDVDNVTIDCKNNINYVIFFCEGEEQPYHQNIAVKNLRVINGTANRFSANRTAKECKNVYVECICDENFSINSEGISVGFLPNYANGTVRGKITRRWTPVSSVISPIANDIFITEAITATNISFLNPVYGTEVHVYNKDTVEHALIDQNFINCNGTETTNRLVIASGKAVALVANPETNNIRYWFL